MPRAPKHCGAPGCLTLVTGRTYCSEHQAQQRRWHISPTSRASSTSWGERQRRAATVTAWVKANGWTCPGWQRDPHPARDLTAAHHTAVANNGVNSALTVLCRSCNSRQGKTTG